MAQIHLQPLYSFNFKYPNDWLRWERWFEQLRAARLTGCTAWYRKAKRYSPLPMQHKKIEQKVYNTMHIKHLTPLLKGWKNVIFKTAQGNNTLWSSISLQTIATIDCMMRGKVIWSRLGVGTFRVLTARLIKERSHPVDKTDWKQIDSLNLASRMDTTSETRPNTEVEFASIFQELRKLRLRNMKSNSNLIQNSIHSETSHSHCDHDKSSKS